MELLELNIQMFAPDIPAPTSGFLIDEIALKEYDDIIRDAMPTVNNATLTIQKNGTTVNTFTANASSNVTANITVPTKTSDITNDSGFIDNTVNNLANYTLSSSLSTVATSGSYNDLSNKPSIPDVSHFITKDVNDLTNYTLKTSTGSYVDLEINQTTYVVTLSLKDQDGNVISTDEIDLPLENVVVSGSYDEINQKIVLTLQSGDTVDIPVGELVAGLQSEITSQSKLASDLVDDSNSGNKFTTISEKQTWNGKYNKPIGGIPKSDLSSDVQTSLGKADTAIQDISGKQDTLIAGTNINIASDGKTISATDTTYNDATTSTSGLMSATDKTKTNSISGYYGTCSTAKGTSAKVVSCSNFVLTEGAVIYVKFTYENTFNGTATLNVNGTGAKDIARVGTTKTTRYYWTAGELVGFVYDGTNYLMIDKGTATTTLYGQTKLVTSATSTSEALALTPKALNSFAQGIVASYPVYSSSATYNVGDRVRYSYGIYECNTAITTAESWTASHWTALSSLQEQIDNKQPTLVSGTNIKTINNESILGSGNISISEGSSYTAGNGIDITSNTISIDTTVVQTVNNKVTSLSSSSTDTQYPSAKCVYDLVGDIETILTTLDVGSGI